MAKGKGSGARDLLYGRRGGGWLPEGHDPMAPKSPIEPKPATKRDEEEEARKARQRAEVAVFEQAHDLVPGSAHHRGEGPGGGPAGGVSWAGKARMATARRDAGVLLNDVDREAIARAERAADQEVGR